MDDWERVETGAPDPDLMARAGAVAEEYEPLVTHLEFDDPLDPGLVRFHLSEGFHGPRGRFDVTWTDRGYYRYHYTEGSQFNYRYDRHPRQDLPDEHFHEPPEAGHDAVPSCIDVTSVRLVTLAVLTLWRDAIEADDIELLQQPHPP